LKVVGDCSVGGRCRKTLTISMASSVAGNWNMNALCCHQPNSLEHEMRTERPYQRQPIVSAISPPRGAPAAAPLAKTIFSTPCHVPRDLNPTRSDTRIETTVVIPPPPIPANAYTHQRHVPSPIKSPPDPPLPQSTAPMICSTRTLSTPIQRPRMRTTSSPCGRRCRSVFRRAAGNWCS